MLQTAIPVIHVIEAARAQRFYLRRLGFKLLHCDRPGLTDPCYLTIERDGARLHVTSYKDGVAGGSSVYIYVDDVDSLHEELTINGVAIQFPPVDQTWGTREFGVTDPDGNRILFGQLKGE